MTRLRATLAKLSSKLVVIVLGVAAIAFLAMFVFQALRIQDMRNQADQKRAELAQYQERNNMLKEQLDFMQSPAYMLYVETVARQALGMAKPGETVILPVPQGANGTAARPGSSGTTTVTSAPTPKPKSAWENWLGFFFGT